RHTRFDCDWSSDVCSSDLYRRLLPEGDAAPDPGDAAARALAEGSIREMRGLDPASLRFIQTTVEKRPKRVDRSYVWESSTVRFEIGRAACRGRGERTVGGV